jgi:hypothetical protein
MSEVRGAARVRLPVVAAEFDGVYLVGSAIIGAADMVKPSAPSANGESELKLASPSGR